MNIDAAGASAPQGPSKGRVARRDRFMIWPLALACGFPVLLVLAWAAPFDLTFLAIPVILPLWALIALITFLFFVVFVRERAWRRAVSSIIFPLASLAAIANASTLWGFAIEAGENIHFRMMGSRYLEHVASLPDTGPRLALFNWGGFVISHAVVYDESDQLLLPSEDRSPEWKKRIAGTELGCGVWGTTVGDHFYIVRIGC